LVAGDKREWSRPGIYDTWTDTTFIPGNMLLGRMAGLDLASTRGVWSNTSMNDQIPVMSSLSLLSFVLVVDP
jgi:hypothetical protein